jgi:hypothetical protein
MMWDPFTLLYYLCAAGGLVMIIGGIWLIYKEKIYIDRATNQVTEIDIPLFGRLKTNVPALALFALGFFPLFFPIYKSQTQFWTIRGNVSSTLHPVIVYAVVATEAVGGDEDFNISVPKLAGSGYVPKVIYVAGPDPLVFQDSVDTKQQKQGVIDLIKKQISPSPQIVNQLIQQAGAFEPDVVKPPAEFSH